MCAFVLVYHNISPQFKSFGSGCNSLNPALRPNFRQGGKSSCTRMVSSLQLTHSPITLPCRTPMRGGVQKSSTGNRRHPSVFCGKHAPQWVISTSSIFNHRKILFSEILISCIFNKIFDIYRGVMASVLT